MWVYILLLTVIFALILFAIIYLIRFTKKILSKYINNKLLLWILSFIPLIIFIIGMYIDFANAVVVDIHLIIFISLSKLIFLIIKKITKKEFNEYLVIIIGIIITALFMTYSYYLAHHVVETDYVVYTDKDIEDMRIVQISDSHLGATMTGKQFSNYMDDINKLNPDIVVITGDYIDDDTSYQDMIDGTNGLGKLKTKYGVYFAYGNHDKGYYNHRNYNDSHLREELKKNNVRILEDEIVEITDKIVLIGRQDREVSGRKDIFSLVENIDKNKYMIVLNHQPNDYANEEKSGVDLVLSGHTHGGQMFPIGQFGVLLGANNKIYGMEKRENTTFIVNSGIGDWAVDFKSFTVSEYVVIDLKAIK